MSSGRSGAASKRVLIVVPAYNEAGSLPMLMEALFAACPQCEVVVVDDGSCDGTADRLAGGRAHVLRHCINRGQGAALQTGIEFALLQGAEVIVTFDADGQHRPEDIAKLVEPIVEGDYDVALGSRFLGHAHGIPWSRKLLLKAAVQFTRIFSGILVTDSHNGLRAFSARAAASIQLTMDRMAHASEILEQIQRGGWRWKEVPVDIYYTPYSMEKGQRSSEALKLLLQLVMKRALQ